jgi:lactoylglutathione lyase
MIRVKDLDKTINFFKLLGLKEVRRNDYPNGKFTLAFLSTGNDEHQIELTHNWEGDEDYTNGRNFGHIAFATENIYKLCEHLQQNGVEILRPPKDGRMAFIKSPDSISIELLQSGDALPIQSPWNEMPNSGEW